MNTKRKQNTEISSLKQVIKESLILPNVNYYKEVCFVLHFNKEINIYIWNATMF